MFNLLPWYYKAAIGVAIAALIGGCFYATYSAGRNAGIAKGDQQGYTRAWNAQQVTINSLVSEKNKLAEDTNTKISNLEMQASIKNAQIHKLLQAQTSNTQQVITEYLARNPVESAQCGLPVEAVQAIRSILMEQ